MSGDRVQVVVVGAAGRMGRMLVGKVAGDPGAVLAGATEMAGHPDLGKDAGTLAGVGELGVPLTDDLAALAGPDTVVIDFTAPASTLKNLEACAGKKAPMVVGTTGMTDADKARAAELATAMPCVIAPNMSMGVNLLFHLVEQAARILGSNFDIEIVEAHHRMKKDAPSGTALGLAEAAARGRDWSLKETGRYCREGMIGARPDNEIGVQTLRGGDIVGEHTVMFAGLGERVEFTHRASSRETFAQGAVRAVHWVQGKKPGVYTMLDVLGLSGKLAPGEGGCDILVAQTPDFP